MNEATPSAERLVELFNQAKALSYRAQAHARIARALAVESRLFREQGRRTRRRA
jgi:hypothetical protein